MRGIAAACRGYVVGAPPQIGHLESRVGDAVPRKRRLDTLCIPNLILVRAKVKAFLNFHGYHRNKQLSG